MSNSASDDWRPAANWDRLRLRDALLRKVRAFFHERGFIEVETPILSHDVVVDRHLDPFQTRLARDPRRPNEGDRLWLQTSPEFGMKRLLAAAGEAIFQVTRAFRNGERGRLHNPEFTIVEWYRREDGYQEGMQLLSDLSETLLGGGPAERITYADAFQRHVGVNPHAAPIDELHAVAAALKLNVPTGFSNDRDGWLNMLLAECLEQHLGAVSRRFCATIPRRKRRWLACATSHRRSPSGSSYMSRELSWPTGIMSCSTRVCSSNETAARINCARWMESRRCQKRAACWLRWRLVFRNAAAVHWALTAW